MRVTPNSNFTSLNKIILVLISCFFFLKHNTLQSQCQIANAGPSRTLCVGSVPVMAANTATGGGIGRWTKISGSGAITNSLSPTTSITGLTAGISTFMWTITNGTCVSSSNMSFTVGPSTALAGPNQTVCVSAGIATLAGNNPVVGTGRWIKVSGPGTITNSLSPTSTITGLTVGTTVLTWSVSFSSCPASTSNMTITIRNVPSVSAAGPSQTLCATTGTATATLNGNNPASGTGIWVKVSGSGTITNPLLRNTTVTGLTPGMTVMTWSISNPPCASSVSNMTIITNALPSIAAAGPDQTVCVSSTATMAANTPTAGTGTWALIGGSGTIVSPNSPTSQITGLGVGNNTFRWRITNPPCAQTQDNIIIVGRAVPSIANAGSNQTICASTGSTTLTGNVPGFGIGRWIKVSGPGVITNSLASNSTLTGLTAGVTVLTWSISNPPCTSSTDNVTITVNDPPSVAAAGTDQTVCVSSGATMAANTSTAGAGLWTLIGGSGTITTPTNPASTITGLGVGNNTFQWTTSNSPCANSSDNIVIVGRAVPSVASAGSNQTICASTGSTTLGGNIPAAGTGEWIILSGPGVITNSLLPNSTLTGLTPGVTVLTWSISNPPCTSSTNNVTITTNALPTAALAGPNQTVCVTSTATMAANNAVSGTGLWTLVSGSGAIATPTNPNTNITGLGVGTNVFAWTISNAPCANSVSNVTITGSAPPNISAAGSNQTICISSPNAIMSANSATAGAGVWTLVSGSGTITNSLSPTTSITGLGLGTNVFAWTIANAPCAPSSSTVSIEVKDVPTTAIAGSSQTLCISSPTTTMVANSATVGIGSWTLLSGSGTITNSLSPTTSITGLAVGTNIFQWEIVNPPCAPSTSTMAIIVQDIPTISSAGSNQTICISSPNTLMTANTATVGTGTWSLISGSGTITNSLSPTTSITGLGLGTNIFEWTIANAPCAPSSSTVSIEVKDVPTTAIAGPSQTLCISTPTTIMTANPALVGIGTWTLLSGSGTITNSLSPTTSITGLAVGTNIFQWTISNPPCTPSSSTMAIVVEDIPTISNAGSNQILCNSSPNTLMTANTATVGIGTWTLISGSGTITNSLSPTTSITGLALGTNVFAWTIANAPCANSVSNVSITVNQVPTIASAGSNQTLCISSPNTTMNGNFPSSGTGVWTLVSGTAVITNSLLATTSVTGLGLGDNVFAWTISNAPCANSVSNVTITVNPAPTVASAGSNQTLCISSPTTSMNANAAVIGTGAWTLVSGIGTITNSLSPTTSITGLGLGNNVFAWTISNAPCANSVSNVTITVNQIPTTANAGSNQTLCISSPTTTMNGNFPAVGTGTWTLVSGTGVITNSLLPTTSVTGLGLGNNVFAWTISNAPCANSVSNVTITVNQAPTIASAGPNQVLCISSPNAIMAANTATVGTGAWTLVSGIGTITNSLSPTTSITGLGLGNNVFAWTISNAPCANSVSNITLTVNQIPTTANAGSNQTLCISSPTATMNGNFPAVGTGTWTLISGTGVITNSLLPTTSVTGLGLGNNVFAWTISNAPCANSVSNVTITVNQAPTVASAGPNQVLCISSPNAIMAANAATVGTGAWTLVSGIGTITNSLSPTTAITGLGLGNNVFAWTISNAPCANSVSNITLTINQIPTTANAGSNQTLCISSPTTTMNANAATVGTGAWTLVSGIGTITNPTLPNSTITGLGLGNNVFAWTISNNPCLASSSTVTITVNQAPTIANAGSNQTLCISSPNAIMAANAATVGTGAWTLVSGIGTITNSLSPTTSITGLGLGNNVFAWTISNAPCANSVSNITLTVNQIPTTANAGSNQTLCISSPTTTMNANTALVGTGAWTLISGTGTITNSLSATTSITGLGLGNNVFAWTISNAPCLASTSTVTLTVNQAPTIANAGSNQTLCISSPNAIMAANAAIVGTGAWTLVSGIGTITNSLSPTTSITGLGLGNNVFAWTISNAPCANSVSNVTITVNQIPTIASAGSSQTLCISSPTTTMNANAALVGTGLWTLVSGSGTITNPTLPNSTITGLALGTNIFAWTISNAPCANSSATMAIVVKDVPTLANAGTNQTICISSPNTIMSANTPTVGTGLWTLVSGSGTITNPTLPNTSITGLALGTNVFAWTISNLPCAASSATMAIIVNDIPTVSNAGINQTVCFNVPTATMTANAPTIGTGLWTLVSGAGTITNPTLPNTSVTALGLGTNVFAWTISNSPCAPSVSNMTIIVNPGPTISNAGTNQTICISSPNTLLNGNTPTSGTGVWTLVSGSGTITNSLSPSTSVTGLGLGNNVFAWTIYDNPCIPSSSSVTITVNDIPTTAIAGSSQTICISSPTTAMTANTPTVGTGLWTLVSGAGTITSPALPNTTITGLALGTNIFAWTISNAPCAPSSSTMAIVVEDVPTIANAGSNQTICISSPNTIMSANTPTVGTGLWTLVSGSGTITNPTLPNTSITGLGLGLNTFVLTISNNPCSPTSSTVTILVNDMPTTSLAGASQTICISSPTTAMAANTPTVGTGLWTLVSGSGTITSPTLPNTTITGLTLGTNIFAWTISNAPCANSSATMAIVVEDVPTIANAGTNQTICISSPNTIMSANTPTVGTGLWTLVSGSGTITNPTSPNTSITGLGLGLNTFVWTISNNPCSPTSSTVTILVNDMPTPSLAGASQTICISSPTTAMAANTPTVGTGLWTLVSGSGTITSPTLPNTTITGLALGTNVFAWTISNAPCANSSATMAIVVEDVPTIANAGTNQTICISSPNTIMSANTPTVGTGLWTLVSGSGTITNPTSPNTSITGLGLGLNTFVWTISNNPCSPTSSTVTILVNDMPTPSLAGPSQTICISSPTTAMAANTPTVGTGLWTLVSGSGSITSPTLPNTTITGLTLGTNVFAWTISNAPCANSSATMAIVVEDVPTIANAGSNQTICISSPNTIMSANTPTVGTGLWTIIAGSGTITNPTSPNTSITGLGLGLNTFVWTISNNPCSPTSSTVSILVNDIPTASFAGIAQVLCISSPNTIMSANTPTVGTGLWTLVSGSGTITSPTSPITSITGLGLGTNVFQWTISNPPCLVSSSTVALTLRDMPTISNSGPTQTICISSPTTTMAANTPTIGTGFWTLVSGTGTITNPTSPNTSITGLGLGINVFAWTISNLPCTASSSTMAIIVDDVPTISNAGSSQNLCASIFTLNANAPTVGTGLWTVIAGGSSVTTPTLNTSAVTSLITGTNTLVWTISNGVCASSSSTINLYVNPFPTPANAGPDQTICTSTAVLNGNSPTIGFGNWTVINGGGAVVTTTLSNSQVTGLTNGVNTFVWTTAFGTCPNSPDTVVIMVDSLPTTALAGTNQVLCSPNATLNANIPIVGIGTWSVVSGGSSVTTPTLNSSGVTGLATGSNIFAWTIVNGVCPASTNTVSVFVDSYPTTANAGTDFTICASTSTLNSNIPSIGTGSWSVIAGGSSVTNPTLNNSTVTTLTTGINTFVWTTSNGTCPNSTDTINIQVDDFASAVSAGPNQAFCLTTTTTNLNASIPAIGVATWSVLSGGGSVTTPGSNTSLVTGLTTGTNSIVWTNTNGVCPATSDTVDIILLQFPTVASAGPDQIICPNFTTLAGNLPSIGIGTWSVATGSGSVSTPTLNTSGVNALATGTNSLVWTTTNGNCPASSDTVIIIVLPPVQQAYAGNDITIYTTSVTLTGNVPTSGTGMWQFVSGSYNIATPNQNSTQVLNLVPGVNTIKWVITEMCGSTEDELNITVVVLPIPTGISPNGDGVNDYLEIPISDFYSKVEVKIVNRWGSVVYENNDYKNTWNGVNQDGQPLADDTYFFVIKLDNEVKTGYILIKR